MKLFKLFCIFIILIFFYKLTYIINNSKKNNQENYLDNIKIIKEDSFNERLNILRDSFNSFRLKNYW